ncbi:MAG TPA: hypothetical protein VIJ59_09035, partial [Caulobacteraceae bacterium]
MRHARAEDLDRLEPLLARLRALPRLSEKSRGVFYLKGRPFLHFHADPAGLFADVRGSDGDFERLRVDDAAGAKALL